MDNSKLKLIKRISAKLEYKYLPFVLFMGLIFIPALSYAYTPEYNLYSNYEVRVHFTGEKTANSKEPAAKIIDNQKGQVKKADITFDTITNTLTIKGSLINIEHLNPNQETIPTVENTIMIYGTKFNNYGMIVPINIKAETFGVSVNQKTFGDYGSKYELALKGTYNYKVAYTGGSTTVNSFPKNGFDLDNPQCFYLGASDIGARQRDCPYPELQVIIDVTLPYHTTTFLSPKKAQVETKQQTFTWYGSF